MTCFKRLVVEQQAKLITSWLESCDDWPLWLFDGMSYYFVSEVKHGVRDEWLKKLNELLEKNYDASLKETAELKF